MNGTLNKGKTFNHDQIIAALLDIQDTFERALMPFLLLEGAAKQLIEGLPFELNEISLGVLEKDWTEYGKTTFVSYRPEAEIISYYEHTGEKAIKHDTSILLKVKDVPIVIWIIHRKYKFFQNPDFRWCFNTEFYLPNPFANYWKCRFIIK